jgi:hypothetical protein
MEHFCFFISLSSSPVPVSRIIVNEFKNDHCRLEAGYLNRYSDGLRAGRPGVQFHVGARFSLLHSVQTDSGPYPASYPIDTGGNTAEA